MWCDVGKGVVAKNSLDSFLLRRVLVWRALCASTCFLTFHQRISYISV
nr:MAG TPA: hypothetical protein [Caudoviricetes sp.]